MKKSGKAKAGRRGAASDLARLGRDPQGHYGMVNIPPFRGSTVLFPTLKSLRERSEPFYYGRRATPSSRALCEVVSALEGAEETLLASSGLGAIAGTLLSLLEQGDGLLVSDGVYGPTRRFCDSVLARLGIETAYYDPTDPEDARRRLTGRTRAIFAESPSSHTFEVQDIPALGEIAREAGAWLIADNTWATPLFLKPLALGADVSINAATKYLAGHADLLLGTISAKGEPCARLRRGHRALGLCAGADDIYLTLRGLRTLGLRLERHQETGLALARFLESRPEVRRVIHPGLASHPQHDLWRRDFTGASGLFGFVLTACPEEALAAMLDDLALFGMGYSWGGFESLILPAALIRTVRRFESGGILLRVHAGLEDARDLEEDLAAGLARAFPGGAP